MGQQALFHSEYLLKVLPWAAGPLPKVVPSPPARPAPCTRVRWSAQSPGPASPLHQGALKYPAPCTRVHALKYLQSKAHYYFLWLTYCVVYSTTIIWTRRINCSNIQYIHVQQAVQRWDKMTNINEIKLWSWGQVMWANWVQRADEEKQIAESELSG